MGYTTRFNVKELKAMLGNLPISIVDVPEGEFNATNYKRGAVLIDYTVTDTPYTAVVNYAKTHVQQDMPLVYLYAPFYIHLFSGQFGVTTVLYFDAVESQLVEQG